MSDYSIKISSNASEVSSDFDDLSKSVKESGKSAKNGLGHDARSKK